MKSNLLRAEGGGGEKNNQTSSEVSIGKVYFRTVCYQLINYILGLLRRSAIRIKLSRHPQVDLLTICAVPVYSARKLPNGWKTRYLT